MIRPIDEYSGKVASPTTEYPDGKAQNITSPGDGTGTPWEAKLVNDLFGFQQFITSKAGITPSGTPDNAVACQQFDALWKLMNVRSATHNVTSDANYTLTASQNLYAWLTVTDTGVLLSAGRDIIIDAVGRFLLFTNSTLQTLTVKVSGGSGVAVAAGVTTILVSDGVNVSLLKTSTPLSNYDLANKKYIDDLIATVGTATLSTNKLLHIQDQKPSGTNGGNSSAGTNTRTLNTVITNTIAGASLASNQITLPAGTYFVDCDTPIHNAAQNKSYLYNVTDSNIQLLGTAEYSAAAASVQVKNKISGKFTIAAPKTFDIRHYATNAQPTNGLGVATAIGSVEIYTDIKIWKVG